MEVIKLCVEQAELEALMRAEEAKKKLEEEEAMKTAGMVIFGCQFILSIHLYKPTRLSFQALSCHAVSLW